MSLASIYGIETPLCGLLWARDDSRLYFIRRFDRRARGDAKIPVYDFAQLTECTRETKYNSSMERVARVLFDYCTFPQVEAEKLFRRILFNFAVGNQDCHLKNFSLIRIDDVVRLSPAYDLVNSQLYFPDSAEIALPLEGRDRNLSREGFDRYAIERLLLPSKVIAKAFEELFACYEGWLERIERSFLSAEKKRLYKDLLSGRIDRLRNNK